MNEKNFQEITKIEAQWLAFEENAANPMFDLKKIEPVTNEKFDLYLRTSKMANGKEGKF